MGVRIKRVSVGRGSTVLAGRGIMKEGQTKNGKDIKFLIVCCCLLFSTIAS